MAEGCSATASAELHPSRAPLCRLWAKSKTRRSAIPAMRGPPRPGSTIRSQTNAAVGMHRPVSGAVFPNAPVRRLAVSVAPLAGRRRVGQLQLPSATGVLHSCPRGGPIGGGSGVRMAGLWPTGARTLGRLVPLTAARAIHFRVMVYLCVSWSCSRRWCWRPAPPKHEQHVRPPLCQSRHGAPCSFRRLGFSTDSRSLVP